MSRGSWSLKASARSRSRSRKAACSSMAPAPKVYCAVPSIVPGRSAARAGPGATRRNRSTSARADVIETSPSSGRPVARPTASAGARNASRISLRASGPVIVPVKLPAPDTGTGGGAHSTSGAMSSVPSRVRSNEVSSRTRLTRPLMITVASRKGAVRRSRVTWLPSKPMRPFTGSAGGGALADPGPHALGLDGAAGADAKPVTDLGQLEVQAADPDVDVAGAIDVVDGEVARREPTQIEMPRDLRRRPARRGRQVDDLAAFAHQRHHAVVDDQRREPQRPGINGPGQLDRDAASREDGIGGVALGRQRDAGQRRTPCQQVVVEAGGGEVESPQPLDLYHQPGPHP